MFSDKIGYVGCAVISSTSNISDVKYPENGYVNKPAVTKHLPKPCFPVRVDDLEEYIMSRRANDCEELRKEYMVHCIIIYIII